MSMPVSPDFEARTRQSAQAGDAQAMYALGGILYQQQNLTEAEQWWRKAAEQGNVEAVLSETDPNEAVTWLTRAAAHGHELAMHNLGYIAYQRGATEEALDWYLKAAQRGYTSSMYNYASLVIDADFAEADRWYTRAAGLGDVGAMRKLATILAERDPTRAEHWARKAAESDKA
jgi:TPR repeat protein